MDPVFPPEIFNLIVTQVALGGDTRDLCSCSLLCKDFAALSQPHLFRYLSIRWYAAEDTKPQLRRLAQCLQTNPVLGEYIQEIYYEHGEYVFENYDEDLDGCLLTLLNLPNVHYLHIRSVSGSIDYNIRRSDIFGYRSMIERYLDSGTLTSLILQGFRNVPIQPILACATLKRVEFSNVAFIDQSPHESITQHALPFRSLQAYQVTNFPYSILKQLQTSLEALDLAYPLPFHQMPVIKPLPNGEFIRFDRLTTLELGSGMDWGSLLGRERGPSCKAFPALKHLNVKLFTDKDESAVSIIFDHLQILEGLELKASTPHPSEYLPSLARVITDMNHTLKSLKFAVTHHNFSQELITTLTESFMSQPRHDLEHLELHLFFRILEPSEIIPPATQDHDDSYQRCWRKIVSCLKDKVRFPRLHLVDITLCLGLDIEKFKEYEDEIFEAFLREPLQDEGFFESTTGGFEVDIMRRDEQLFFL